MSAAVKGLEKSHDREGRAQTCKQPSPRHGRHGRSAFDTNRLRSLSALVESSHLIHAEFERCKRLRLPPPSLADLSRF